MQKDYKRIFDEMIKQDLFVSPGAILQQLPQSGIAERTEPTAMKLAPLWENTDVETPGNILVVPGARRRAANPGRPRRQGGGRTRRERQDRRQPRPGHSRARIRHPAADRRRRRRPALVRRHDARIAAGPPVRRPMEARLELPARCFRRPARRRGRRPDRRSQRGRRAGNRRRLPRAGRRQGRRARTAKPSGRTARWPTSSAWPSAARTPPRGASSSRPTTRVRWP